MQTIGGQLEEARQRKGISLREAAEATKVRSDFLGYIEQNKMDFDLPDIYKRGFLKNYARYLKLDADKLLTDYDAQLLSYTRKTKERGVELFGQMEIKKSSVENNHAREEIGEKDSYGSISTEAVLGNGTQDLREEEADKTFYMKIGLIFVGTLALVFVVFGLIWAILDGDNPNKALETIKAQEETAGGQSSEPLQAVTEASSESITLIASGNVYVLVKQQSDNKELMRKTLSEGESITLEKDGAVDIIFTAGENLQIEHGGELLRPRGSGTAKISIE